jgi:flagellar hook-associated protein FlgK
MIGAISNALQGLMTASQSANKAAERIANVSSEGYTDTIELTEEAINLKIAESSFKANIATIRTIDDMSQELMRIFDERV